MKALAVCSTYGRLPYLGRMLSSFASQTYDDKHLVIVNDDKNIELCCDRKDVTILNCRSRLFIPFKRNLGIAIGDHDVIFPMDDDDVFLPQRMANHITKMGSSIEAYWNRNSYIIYGDVFRSNYPGPHNAITFTKKAWFKANGYSNNGDFEDYDMFTRLEKVVKVEEFDDERDFVYQFGGVNYHVSIMKKDLISYEEMAYNQLQSMGLVGKKFWINPDFEQFNNMLLLEKMFKEGKEEMVVKHISDAKIDISHLL